MTEWMQGYFADAGYTYGFFPEMTPSRLNWVVLNYGLPPKTKNFRYLDLGCGQGMNLIYQAISHPDSEFIGIDFLPEHVNHANSLVNEIGIKNIQFLEMDFNELLDRQKELGSFDFIVTHGIIAWINPKLREILHNAVGKLLQPGGVYYCSYNTMPGWLHAAPFQKLVVQYNESTTGQSAIQRSKDVMDVLKNTSAAIFNAQPGLATRLQLMSNANPAYLVQEYNNKHWTPLYVCDVIEELGASKLKYTGTATLTEMYDFGLPPVIKKLLAEQQNIKTKELIRDLSLNQAFRRDVYTKGRNPLTVSRHREAIGSLAFMANPLIPRPKKKDPFIVKYGILELKGDPILYHQIMQFLDQQPDTPVTLDKIITEMASTDVRTISSAISLLMQGGWILHHVETDTQLAKKLNRIICDSAVDGIDYKHISTPKSGGAYPMLDIDWHILRCIYEGYSRESWIARIEKSLSRINKKMQIEGKPIEDKKEIETRIGQFVQDFMNIRLPFLQKLGAI